MKTKTFSIWVSISIAVMFISVQSLAQNLEVVGQAKITVMNTDNTADQIVVKQPDGTLALRAASTLKELPQSPLPGEMLYWDGTAWVSVTIGTDGQMLTLCDGVPTWTSDGDCTPNVTSPTGIIWMDRNLGATQVATSSTDVASYGDLYQWGRGTDGHQIRTSGTTTILSTTDQPGHGDFILVINHPYDWRSGQNNNLWQGVNGVNNPCPSDYRVPTVAEWEQERLSWSSNNAAGAFTSPLKLPAAGNRSNGNGSLGDVGTRGGYWSSTVSSTVSHHLGFGGGGAATMNGSKRAGGLTVRCLKD